MLYKFYNSHQEEKKLIMRIRYNRRQFRKKKKKQFINLCYVKIVLYSILVFITSFKCTTLIKISKTRIKKIILLLNDIFPYNLNLCKLCLHSKSFYDLSLFTKKKKINIILPFQVYNCF